METSLKRSTGWLAIFALLLGVPGVASAAGAQLYDWSSEKAPIMVSNDSGVLFVGKDREVRRAYGWRRANHSEKRGMYMPDIDEDGDYEVVGAGDPTFAVDTDSDPIWNLEGGCDQVIVANFWKGDRLEILCNQGTKLSVYTHDYQKIWTLDPGVSLDYCRAGDINGDLKADIECKRNGREKWIRLDSSGKISSKAASSPEIQKGSVDLDEASSVGKGHWNGKKEWDLNGDGTAEESLQADGSAIVVQSRSQDSAVARSEFGSPVQAATVKNIDGKKKPEIIVLTDSKIVVLNNKAEEISSSPADAGDYDRRPVAKFESVYARKFSDNEKAQKSVRDAKSELAECYESQVRGKLVVGTGEINMIGYVGADGTISRTELMHSAVNDDDLRSCVEGVLEGLEYPKPEGADGEGGAKEAKVTLVIQYTFEDRP